MTQTLTSFPPYRLIPGLTALVPEFLQHTQTTLDSFAQALSTSDYALIKQVGHNLKGSGASFGFAYFSQLGEAIEIAADAQQPAQLQQLFTNTQAYFDWVRATLPATVTPSPALDSAFANPVCDLLRRRSRPETGLRRYRLAQLGRALQARLKRMLDVVGASALLVLLAPLLVLVALAIWLEDGGPVLFSQPRVGKGGRCFAFYKFRSMVPDAEARKAALQHLNESGGGVIFKSRRDPRITRVGRWIRRFSIDELPQLYHVLTGEMSLVGPRPPVPAEVALYTPAERKRLDVTPGLTCIWQVSGRSEIPFQQQVQMDQTYIQRQSLWLDLGLLLRTVRAVLTGRGAY